MFEAPRRLPVSAREQAPFLGTSDFRAGDEQRRIGRRSEDTEKEERFLAHTSDTSCLTCAFSLHKDDVTVYMFLPKQNKKPLTNARAKRLITLILD